MVYESSRPVSVCNTPSKQGVCGEWVLTIPGTALFSALPKLPSALQYLRQYCRLYVPPIDGLRLSRRCCEAEATVLYVS